MSDTDVYDHSGWEEEVDSEAQDEVDDEKDDDDEDSEEEQEREEGEGPANAEDASKAGFPEDDVEDKYGSTKSTPGSVLHLLESSDDAD